MRIVDKLFIKDADVLRSKEICLELKKLSEALPEIMAEEEKIKHGELWVLLETQRKLLTLGCTQTQANEIQATISKTQYRIKEPRKAWGEQVARLSEELHKLTTPILTDINSILKREMVELLALKKCRLSEKRQRAFIIQHNFKVIEVARGLIDGFRVSADLPIDQILKEVKAFEVKFNKVDLGSIEDEEVDRQRYNDLQDAKLL